MLQSFIVEISIGRGLAGLRMRLVHLIAGLIEQHAVGVFHSQFDVGGAFLRNTGREAVSCQRHGFHANQKRLAGRYRPVRFGEVDARRGF